MRSKICWKICSAVTLAFLILLPTGCSKEEPADDSISAIEQTEPAPKKEMVFTQKDPGPWSGKEGAHVPKITYTKTEAGGQVVVIVDHEMNSETPHFIMWIELRDGEDKTLGEKIFQDTDEKAEATFSLSSLPGKIKAISKCNLHGLWSNEIDVQQD